MKKEVVSEILMSVCVLILGVCLTVWADKVTTLVSILLGVLAVIYGISALVSYFSNKEKLFNEIGDSMLIIEGNAGRGRDAAAHSDLNRAVADQLVP